MNESAVKLANLSSLQSSYWNASTQKAFDFLQSADDEKFVVLDSHLLRTPTAKAVKLRDGVDQLLQYYSILELGLLTGALDEQAQTDEARQVLSMPAMVRYYQRFYPLALPSLHLQRLNGDPLVIETDSDMSRFLQTFLDLNIDVSTPEVQLFLWFLDDGYTDGKGFPHFLRLLTNGEAFVRAVACAPDDRRADQTALVGFLDFLSFASRFNEFLLSRDLPPRLRSAFWHFHGYWFQQLGGQVLGALTAGVESLRNFVAPAGQEFDDERSAEQVADDIRATHRSMDRSIRDLQRLTSAFFRYEIDLYQLAPPRKILNGALMVGEPELFEPRRVNEVIDMPGVAAQKANDAGVG